MKLHHAVPEINEGYDMIMGGAGGLHYLFVINTVKMLHTPHRHLMCEELWQRKL